MASAKPKPLKSLEIKIPFEANGKVFKAGFALDCGGTLIKLAIITERDQEGNLGVLLESFERKHFDDVLAHLKGRFDSAGDDVISVTMGHGTLSKQATKIKETLNITPVQIDEFTGFAKGLHYGLKHTPPHTFIDGDLRPEEERHKHRFPALLAMVGSGVSYILVNEDGSQKHVHGITKGGLYCYGVGKLLTGAETFDDFVAMARRGDAKKVTTTTDEIFKEQYGEMDWNALHESIPFDIEVFPFGKIISEGLDLNQLNKDDIARAWLNSVCIDIADASLTAARTYCSENTVVYFAGSLAENDLFQDYLKIMPYCNIFDERVVHPCYIRNGGFLGCIGALLVGIEKSVETS